MMVRILLGITMVALPLAVAAPYDAQSTASCPVTKAVRATPPKDPNAAPFGSGPWYINADRSVWAGWAAIRLRAGGRGNKVLWIRPAGTDLVVSARRLDSEAGTFEVEIPCCYPTGFQPSGLHFSEPGCWEISGNAGKSSLTFITRVLPECRLCGLTRGGRQ